MCFVKKEDITDLNVYLPSEVPGYKYTNINKTIFYYMENNVLNSQQVHTHIKHVTIRKYIIRDHKNF